MPLDKTWTYTSKKSIPSFLITLRVAGKNLHNYIMDSGDGANIMSYEVYKALNLPIAKSSNGITQLDNTLMKLVGMIHNLRIQIAFKPWIE